MGWYSRLTPACQVFSSVLPEPLCCRPVLPKACCLWTLQTLAWAPQTQGVPQRAVELAFHERILERPCLT